jgi:hypothetical protein
MLNDRSKVASQVGTDTSGGKAMKVQSLAMKKDPVAVQFSVAVILLSFLGAPAVADITPPANRQLVDARTVRHCHNTARRVYCHTSEKLPLTIRSTGTVRT